MSKISSGSTIDMPRTGSLADTRDLTQSKMPGLPSGHISQATVIANHFRAQLFDFDSGIEALESEKEGQRVAYEASIADLDRRLADLNFARDILQAGLTRAEQGGISYS